MEKQQMVAPLLEAQKASGKTYDQLAKALGLCNVYVAQLFRLQAQLTKETAARLVALVPGHTGNCWKRCGSAPGDLMIRPFCRNRLFIG